MAHHTRYTAGPSTLTARSLAHGNLSLLEERRTCAATVQHSHGGSGAQSIVMPPMTSASSFASSFVPLPVVPPGSVTTVTPVTTLDSNTPMQLLTVMTPVTPMAATTIPVAWITKTVAAKESAAAPTADTSAPAATETTSALSEMRARQKNLRHRHNAAEQRRVRKLTHAYMELHALFQRRPELVVDAATDAPPTLRHYHGANVFIEDDGGGSAAVGCSTGTAPDYMIGPSVPMPPHHQVLYRSAATIDALFSVVDLLSSEVDRLTQVPQAGAHLVDQAFGRAAGMSNHYMAWR